jgi:hypothetical protein
VDEAAAREIADQPDEASAPPDEIGYRPLAAPEPVVGTADEIGDPADRQAVDAAAEAIEWADERLAERSAPPPIPPEADVVGLAEAAPSGTLEWADTVDDDFSPFAHRQPAETRKRSGVILFAVVVLAIAAIVAAIWMFAPSEWKERLGIANAGETPLELMMTHSDRQKLASGNELLAVSGRVINPTSKTQTVPPIRAELHSSTGQLVYSWTIPPPAPTLPPGGSASFNSAELNIPPGAEELTVTLGEPKA